MCGLLRVCLPDAEQATRSSQSISNFDLPPIVTQPFRVTISREVPYAVHLPLFAFTEGSLSGR